MSERRHKRSRDEDGARTKKSKKSRGKQRLNGDVSQIMQDGSERAGQSMSSDFKHITTEMRLPLAPIFSDAPLEGIRECLESWIMRYISSIDAVLLTVSWPPTLLQANAELVESSAFALARVRWEGIGFRPQIGSTSVGKLSLATPSVISLLLHNLFNASISAEHIPKDTYEWDANAVLPYSLAPPGLKAPTQSRKTAEAFAKADNPGEPPEEPADVEEEAEVVPREVGCWVHKETREPLGGLDGRIAFTVIGLTIANSMISVHGSLAADPLATIKATKKDRERKEAPKKAAVSSADLFAMY